MSGRVDLYDSHYASTGEDAYRQIRMETYGEDLGQTSWITADEARRFFAWLAIPSHASMLEIACGSGGLSLLAARELGATVTGVDINEQAVRAAREVAGDTGGREGLPGRISFQVQDASRPLPFDEEAFDIVFCNDSINHLPERSAVLRDWWRLLKPSGKILYTDPIIATGALSNHEIAVRSSIGFFLFIPPGENERLLEACGFEILKVEDVTQSTAEISLRWYESRRRREQILVQVEGQERYDGLQRFLEVVHRLASEQRLSRFAFLAVKRP